MNRALVDTDILSEILRARNPTVTRRERRYVEEYGRLSLSVVTVFEVARALGIDAECARLAGEIDGALERAGRRVGVADVLIAATAMRSGRTLVTANTSHYERIRHAGFQVQTENWR